MVGEGVERWTWTTSIKRVSGETQERTGTRYLSFGPGACHAWAPVVSIFLYTMPSASMSWESCRLRNHVRSVFVLGFKCGKAVAISRNSRMKG
jgi:hypothetical protein